MKKSTIILFSSLAVLSLVMTFYISIQSAHAQAQTPTAIGSLQELPNWWCGSNNGNTSTQSIYNYYGTQQSITPGVSSCFTGPAPLNIVTSVTLNTSDTITLSCGYYANNNSWQTNSVQFTGPGTFNATNCPGDTGYGPILDV